MGCDIHFYTEAKIKGKWHSVSSPSLDRWYTMFEKMAGVRGDPKKAIVAPKGLPPDLSEYVTMEYLRWKGDAHTPSWLNVSEIKQLEIWLEEYYKKNKPDEYFYPEKLWGYINGMGYGDFKSENTDDCVEDVRFVFWFDN